MNKFLRKILEQKWSFLAVLILLVVAAYGFHTYSLYKSFLSTPLKISGYAVEYTVKPGVSMRHIAQQLTAKGLLSRSSFLVVRARMRGLAQSIKVGEYVIHKGTLPDDLLDQFVKGKVKQYSLTLIEGKTFRDLLFSVNSHKQLRHTISAKPDQEIMKAIGQQGSPEGRFFPDTYWFPTNTTDVEFLKRAYHHMDRYLNAEWDRKSAGLPLKTPYEALILASIIEKETAQKNEYAKIAGVFIRRLKRKIRLQTDPTVIYGLGKRYTGNLKRKHLREDNPYNTYTRKGLPPTPIAMPGARAIHAALHPAKGETLYFVSMGNGKHHFSKTLKEHNEAVIRYQLKGDRTRTFSSRPVAKKNKINNR